MRRILAAAALLLCSVWSYGQDASGYILTPGTQIENFESLTGWSSGGYGTMALNTAHAKSGASSIKITSTGGDEVYARRAIDVDMTNTNTVSFWVYIEQPWFFDVPWEVDHSSQVEILLTRDNFDSYVWARKTQLHKGWNKLEFCREDFKQYNGGTWGRMNALQLIMYRKEATTSASFDDLRIGQFSRPKVLISFDDGYASTFTEGYQYMRGYGLKGTSYIVRDLVGEPDYMTRSQIQELYNNGWDIANHTVDHKDLSTLSRAEQNAEIVDCRNYLIANGWTRNNMHLHVAYPYGHYNGDTLDAAEFAKTLTGRTIWERTQSNSIDEVYQLATWIPDGQISSAEEIRGLLDRFLKTGGLFELAFHNIVQGASQGATQWNVQEFRAIVDYIAYLKNQGLVDVVTKTEWYNGQLTKSISSVDLAVSQLIGGQGTNGSIELVQPAFDTGANVTLSSNKTAVVVPSQITIPFGARTGAFTVQTTAVTVDTTATITASYLGKSASATLLVKSSAIAPSLASLTLSSNRVTSGSTLTGTVALTGLAVSSTLVSLTGGNSYVTMPSSVTISAGASSQAFTITTLATSTSGTVTLVAQLGSISRGQSLTYDAYPTLTSFVINPNSVRGGTSTTGTVTLSRSAPTGGIVVAITDNSAYASVPSTVTVPAGAKTASFTITTSIVGSSKTATVTAKFGGVARSRVLSISP